MLKYELFINPKKLQQLNKDIWKNDHVPAILKKEGEQFSVSVCYRGNVIRKRKKKSYHIIFQKPSTFNGAHEIHLNAEFTDRSLSRNKLSLDFFHQIGVISPHSKHVLLYINGTFKGIYLELESFDQYFLQKRKLPDGPIIYATNNRANFSLLTPKKQVKRHLKEGYTLKYGDNTDMDDLEQWIALINSMNNEDFENEMEKYLNVEQYLKWLAGVVCTHNFDGFIHNYALYRNGETNTYEITPWDYDGTWGRNLHGKLLEYDYIPITGYNTLTARLLHYTKIRRKYKEILLSILENHFTVDGQNDKLCDIFDTLTPHISQDPYINLTEDDLEAEKEIILQFIRNRSAFLMQKLNELD